jgi:WD40 repeat protein
MRPHVRLTVLLPLLALQGCLTDPARAAPFKERPLVYSAVAFTPDGKHALSGDSKGRLLRWDLATGKYTGLTRKGPYEPIYICALALSADGRWAVTGEFKHIRLWDVRAGKEVRVFHGDKGGARAVAFSGDGRQLASSGRDDHTARLWDVAAGKERLRLTGHTQPVHAVAFSADGRYVLSGSEDRTARLWDAKTGRPLRVLACSGWVGSAAFLPTGRYVLTAGGDGAVTLWEAASGRPVRSLLGKKGVSVQGLALSPDGRSALASGDDRCLRLWDLRGGLLLQALPWPEVSVSALAFAPDGRRALAGGEEGLALWDVAAGKKLLTLDAVRYTRSEKD